MNFFAAFFLFLSLLSVNLIRGDAQVWISDGSPGMYAEGNLLYVKPPATPMEPQNAFWQTREGMSSGDHYWKFTFDVVQGVDEIGVTSEALFGPGWNIKGLFYNSNLSNGGSALVTGFGPSIATGDIIGMLVSIQSDRVQMYLDINGISLGLAFDVPFATLEGPLFPAVRFADNGAVTIEEVIPPPQPQPRTQASFATYDIQGAWAIDPASVKCATPVDTAPPFGDKPLASIGIIKREGANPEANVYPVGMRVVNLISFFWSNPVGTDIWNTSVQRTTLMVGSPLEDCLVALTLDPTYVFVAEDGRLNIEKGSLFAAWNRYNPAPTPFYGDPFAK